MRHCAMSLQGRALSGSLNFFSYGLYAISAKTSCPVQSVHPIPSHPGQDKMDIWVEILHGRLNEVSPMQYPLANVIYLWHLRKDILSHPIPSPCGQDWNCHISTSNQDRTLIFGSYERSWKALLDFIVWLLWWPFPGNHKCKKVKKSRNYYFEPVIQVKIGFSEFEYQTELKQCSRLKFLSKVPNQPP